MKIFKKLQQVKETTIQLVTYFKKIWDYDKELERTVNAFYEFYLILL